MLTETQFKVLMILFDDKGHAGWELAEALGMQESNLNPKLKKLEKRNIIFQGQTRKSNRPKKPKGLKKSENVEKAMEVIKREGDYKEVPYYLIKDLNTLGTIIREMVVTNRAYDIGFPCQIIRASNYMRSMRAIFKEDLNKLWANFSKEASHSRPEFYNIRIDSQEALEAIERLEKELCSPNGKREALRIKDKRVSESSLVELELWYECYLDNQTRELQSPDED